MASAWCEKCDSLVGISSRGERKNEFFSAEWQYLDVHAAPDPENPGQKRICEGSGNKL